MNKKAQLTVIGSAIILLTVVTITYGFFTAGVNNNNAQTATVQAGTMELTFADNDTGISKEMIFGESIEKKFTIENTGTLDADAYLYWKDLVNTYLYGSLVYKLEYSETEDGTKKEILKEQNVPNSTNLEQLSNKLTVPADTTYYYTLTITLINSETVDQTADINASFTTGFDIKVDGTAKYFVEYPVMMSSWREECILSDEDGISVEASSITIVNKADTDTIANADAIWDISEAQNGSVMGYVIGDDIIIAGNGSGKIALPQDSSHIFEDCYCDFIGLELFDTSNATNMANMFGASYITSTNSLSQWDTSNVTDMSGMFNDCYELTSIDGLSNWDVSNVTDMSYMISITQVTSLDAIANWDVSNVTDMEYMFGSSYKLVSIDGIANWNVSNVTNMEKLFYDCEKLTSIESLANWDVSNVTNMKQMFYSCENLTSVEALTNWNVSNVTNMSGMFNSCRKLTSAEALNNWTLNESTDLTNMFKSCSTSLILPTWYTTS